MSTSLKIIIEYAVKFPLYFVRLLRELGYEVKAGVHIAVKVPGMKWFARLDTIDKRVCTHIHMWGNLEQSIAEAQGREVSFPVRTFNTNQYRDRATAPYQERPIIRCGERECWRNTSSVTMPQIL